MAELGPHARARLAALSGSTLPRGEAGPLGAQPPPRALSSKQPLKSPIPLPLTTQSRAEETLQRMRDLLFRQFGWGSA